MRSACTSFCDNAAARAKKPRVHTSAPGGALPPRRFRFNEETCLVESRDTMSEFIPERARIGENERSERAGRFRVLDLSRNGVGCARVIPTMHVGSYAARDAALIRTFVPEP